jgi:uncharacterized repeat protein (TIGR03803 family)
VIAGKDGVLYGATLHGGSAACDQGCGVVYSLSPAASPGGAWTDTVLYSFTGGAADGSNPFGLVMDENGVLYGIASGGIFQLAPPSSPGGAWTEAPLYTPQGGNDGLDPAAIAIGKNGVISGSTYFGGTGCATGCGTLFTLTPPSAPGGAWTEEVIYRFAGGSDGSWPNAIALDRSGVIYGTTLRGTSLTNGTVFGLTPPASPHGAWTKSLLHTFDGAYGGQSFGGLAIGSGGELYGTTYGSGRKNRLGSLFEMIPPASPEGTWKETVLHAIEGGPDGRNPDAGVAVGQNGALYGTTSRGGEHCKKGAQGGCGTVFQVNPPAAGGRWTETRLRDFANGRDGNTPLSGVVIGPNGALYGTTSKGGDGTRSGKEGWGTVFEVVP